MYQSHLHTVQRKINISMTFIGRVQCTHTSIVFNRLAGNLLFETMMIISLNFIVAVAIHPTSFCLKTSNAGFVYNNTTKYSKIECILYLVFIGQTTIHICWNDSPLEIRTFKLLSFIFCEVNSKQMMPLPLHISNREQIRSMHSIALVCCDTNKPIYLQFR